MSGSVWTLDELVNDDRVAGEPTVADEVVWDNLTEAQQQSIARLVKGHMGSNEKNYDSGYEDGYEAGKEAQKWETDDD